MDTRKHDFKEYGFDPSGVIEINGKRMVTCTHVLKCILCDLVIGDSENPKERIACNDFRTEMNDCPGKKPPKVKEAEKPKEPWKSPMKERKIATDVDIETKDYPAKRNGHEAKKRRR